MAATALLSLLLAVASLPALVAEASSEAQLCAAEVPDKQDGGALLQMGTQRRLEGAAAAVASAAGVGAGIGAAAAGPSAGASRAAVGAAHGVAGAGHVGRGAGGSPSTGAEAASGFEPGGQLPGSKLPQPPWRHSVRHVVDLEAPVNTFDARAVIWQRVAGLVACSLLVAVMAALALSRLERPASTAEEALKATPGSLCGSLDIAHGVPQPAPPLATEQESEPSSEPRLAETGASFAVPIDLLAACAGDELAFDILAWPDVWPFHASLQRPRADGPWHRLDLTVDVLAASTTPPLFTCCRASTANGSASRAGRLQRLEVTNSSGALEGVLEIQKDGSCGFVCEGKPQWDIEVRPRRVVVRQGARELAMTTWHPGGGEGAKEARLQVDVQSEPGSRDAALLLLCVLAVAAFHRGGLL